jgi:hypothetical protein
VVLDRQGMLWRSANHHGTTTIPARLVVSNQSRKALRIPE